MTSMNGSLSVIEAQAMAQYIQTFLDLVDNIPNDISRHVTQLHVIHNNYLKLINRMDQNLDNYNKLLTTEQDISYPQSQVMIDKRRGLMKKIEIQLIQIQELADEKLRYSQLIIDLIEMKAKELDLDYEEVMRFNSRPNSIVRDNVVHNGNGGHNKPIANITYHSSNASNFEIKEEKYTKNVNNEDKSDGKVNDKRLLPRRACAVKSSQIIDIKDTNDESYVPKVTQNKIIKSKKYSKSHNFGLSMANYYRDMARRRATLPKVAKMVAKLKDKNCLHSVKQSAKKSNRKPIKRLIEVKSNKQMNSTNNLINKKVNNKSSDSMSSSSSSSSSSNDNEIYESPKVLNNSNINGNQMNTRRESKRTSSNTSNSSSNKKGKSNSNHTSSSSVENMFIGEPVDPNEPTYCLCSQVSYGEMICCDNAFCPIEWFHFPCVHLSHKPKGKWFCPKCRKGDKYSVPKRTLHSAKD
ncbi:inhibitor of growth protein 2-like [Oppia nitens]|uniref:inhibitor of growth protein 2-like n=1 Tax=Oppia nitens TaxID=1686743 RepID=UPI0023DC5BB1|nr:inhibitor of growth protein 2-like [Oppia nitens]